MKICVRRRIVQKVGSSSVVDLYFTVNSDGRAVTARNSEERACGAW
jgi:hypothetical protein